MLARRGDSFVVVGGWAAQAQGLDLGHKTNDIGFTPGLGAGNWDRLSAALYDLGAEIRSGEESLPFNHSGRAQARSSPIRPAAS